MSTSRAQTKAERKRVLRNRARRIACRLRARTWDDRPQPMFSASNIHYALCDRNRGLGEGGLGAMHLLARRAGLIERIDE